MGRASLLFFFFLEEIIFGVLKGMKERDTQIGVDVGGVVACDIGRHCGGG